MIRFAAARGRKLPTFRSSTSTGTVFQTSSSATQRETSCPGSARTPDLGGAPLSQNPGHITLTDVTVTSFGGLIYGGMSDDNIWGAGSGAAAGDLDGDGDLDLAVAGFGYDDGETSWLENKGGWQFEQHVIQRLSGVINAIVVDLDGDQHPDIVTLVSQEWEEVWAFLNDGKGNFTAKLLWGSTNPDFGSSWITVVDLDRDGDPDILYSNGDAFDYAPANSRPWHGVQWLENRGGGRFEHHPLTSMAGAMRAVAADFRGAGKRDVVAVSSLSRERFPQRGALRLELR